MQCIECLDHILVPDHKRDIAFRTALCDRPDIHPVFTEKAENLPRDTVAVFHAVANRSDQRHFLFDPDRIDALLLKFVFKFLLDAGAGSLGIRLIDSYRNCMLA